MRVERDVPAPAADAASARGGGRTTCFKSKTCVCTGAGADAWHFHSNLVSLLKPHMTLRRNKKGEKRPRKERLPVARRLLEEALVVLELTREESGFAPDAAGPQAPHSTFSAEGWGMTATCEMPAAIEDRQETLGAQKLWLHMSYCNFRSWNFATLELHEAADQPFRDKKVLNVPAQPVFRSCFQTNKELIDFNWPWLCTVHFILQDEEFLTIHGLTPDVVEVSALSSLPTFRVWKARCSGKVVMFLGSCCR